MLFGGLACFAIGFALGEASRFHVNARTLGALAYLTILGSIVAYSAYVYALAHMRTTHSSLYAYINPVVAVILGWLILHVDLRNLLVEHSPFRYRVLHERTFRRFIGERLHAPEALPVLISLTRLRDRTNVIFDARQFDDPLRLLLASNYFFPYFTHAPLIDGHRYGDGGATDNAPYERVFAEGCDAVVIVSQKGESEGGLFKRIGDVDHEIPESLRDRVVVIRPRHRMPVAFTEKRWPRLAPIADLGYLRSREVLLGERHPETDLRARGPAPSAYVTAVVRGVRRAISVFGQV